MRTSQKDLKNIPISISILHEQEYNNLYLIMKGAKVKKRRAYSERSSDKSDDSFDDQPTIKLYGRRRKTLKN